MALPWMAIAQLGMNLSNKGDLKTRSASRYDPFSGESYNKTSEQLGFMQKSLFNPLSVLGDERLSVGEKALSLIPIVGSGIVGSRLQERNEERRMKALATVKESLGQTPAYESPEQAAQLQNVTSTGAETMRGIGSEMVQLAQARQQKGMPGEAIRKNEVENYARAAVDNFIETGGASSLDAIVATRNRQAEGLLQMAEQANARSYGAERDFLSALSAQGSIGAQAAQMEGMGLQSGISEAGKLYQSELEQVRPMQQFAITQYGNRAAQLGG